MAAVDGELVNKALGRFSGRHRQVLAMREGSGWTYQQIADHEGVEIGTIETLLWRARQALKREFTVLSESKGMLGGFLAGAVRCYGVASCGWLIAAPPCRRAGKRWFSHCHGRDGVHVGRCGRRGPITPHALSTGGAVGASGPPSALGTAGSNLAGTDFVHLGRAFFDRGSPFE